MFCEKCGRKNPDGAAFCEGCGSKMVMPQPAAQPQQQTAFYADPSQPQVATMAPPQPDAPNTPPAPKAPFPLNIIEKLPPVIRNNLKLVLIAAGGFIVLLIALIVVLVMLSNNVDLEDYFTVKTTGFDKYGSVEYTVDYNGLTEEISDGEYSSKASDYKNWSDLLNAAASAVDYSAVGSAVDVEVKYPADKTNGALANGDVVTFIVTFDAAVADRLDVDVDTLELEYEIEGLGKADVYDIFENIGLTFEGYNGFGRAVITGAGFEKKVGAVTFRYEENSNVLNCTSEKTSYPNIYFEFDKENAGLKNGDKIKFVATDIETTTFASAGFVLKSVEKEFTVSGLKESQNYDVLSNFEIKFTGVDGDGYASIVAKESSTTIGSVTLTTTEGESCVRYEDSENSYNDGNIYLEFSEHDDLKNGDKITVTTNFEADRLAEYGIVLTNMSKEYTVSGLGQYAKKASEIKKDSVNTLFESIKEDLSNRLYDSWGRTVHDSYRDFEGQKIGKDMKLHKAFLTTPKNTTSDSKNTLWVVVSVTLKDDSMDKDTAYYFYYSFSDVAVNSDKELALESANSAKKKSRGYTDYAEIYDDNINKFNVTVEEIK